MMLGKRYAALRHALEREYRIHRVIEEAEDGATYQAQDVTLNRRVVIKAVDPALAGDARTEAFLHEARVLAGLSHPAIPSVHHAGPIGDFLYIVLEQTGGGTLERRLGDGPLDPEEVIRLGEQLLGALDVVHAAGLVHTEVSGRTVLVEEGRYLLDGFASAVPAESPDAVLGDLRAAGVLLVEAAGGSKGEAPARLPRLLRRALARALSSDPAQHWRSAADFREALLAARRRPVPWRGMAAVAAALLLFTGSYAAWRRQHPNPIVPPPRELAILPLEVDGGPPLDPFGSSLAYLVQLDLENVPGLALTSRRQVDDWWEAQGPDAPGVEGAQAARALRAHWVALGLVERRTDDALRLRLLLVDSLGARHALPEIVGSAGDLAEIGDSITLRIIRVVAPRADNLFEPVAGLEHVPLAAMKAFLQGEAAFAGDAWAEAQRHYEAALQLDSTFGLAEWRLSNVKRWRRLPFEGDLPSVYRRQAARLRARDRLVIEALLEPDLRVRFARLDSVVARFPADGYTRLLQGEELFHRGPLVGRGVDQAVPVMADAVARDPSLALAYDHLVVAAVRFGRREEAARALDLRRRVGGNPGVGELNLLPFLDLVYDERFVPWRAWARYRYIAWRQDPRQLAGIETVARASTPWLDLPATQLRYCDLLLRSGRPTAETHITAHEGKGVAFFALGRPEQALAELDSSSALLDTPAARLQQAEWRVLPPAMGLPETRGGREWSERLEELAGDTTLAPRALWALALAAQSRGDTLEARRWTGRLRAGDPLRVLLEARDAALRGDPALALARSDSVRLAFQVTRPPDVFAGAAFHLLRGDWLAALGDPEGADREWLWYEASDVEGWPQGLAQAGEVDAALGVFARLKRARGLLLSGASATDSARACVHLRRVLELWREAEPVMQPLVRESATLARRCPA